MHGPIKKLEREAVDVFAFGFEQRAREIVQAGHLPSHLVRLGYWHGSWNVQALTNEALDKESAK